MPTPGKIKDDRPFDKHLGGFWPSGGGNDKMSKHPPWDKDIFGASGLWDIFPADKMSGIEKHKVLSGSVGKVPEDWKKKWPIG